jgi:hypothetical protein
MIAKRPLPTKEDALAFAREMVPRAKWGTIELAEGSTDDGGEGLLLQAARDCWILSYDPLPGEKERGEERVWVEKATGGVVKMSLEE